jgi:RimJ/RimL family protein N-acetyltransferase
VAAEIVGTARRRLTVSRRGGKAAWVIDLDPRATDAALASLRALPINTLFVQSVLRGHADGRCQVDDPRAPGAFYAVHAYGMALLWGRAAAATEAAWLAWLRRRLVAPEHPAEWLQVYPDAWVATVEAALGDQLVATGSPGDRAGGALRCTRLNFAFDRERYGRARGALEAAIAAATVAPTSAAMFAELEGSVVPRRFWRDAGEFAASGGGFSVIVDGAPAATAFCSFRHGAQLEIGIETAPRHRGKGLARIAACALIDHCLAHGLEPVWACRLENTASVRLAGALGFVAVAEIPYYRLPSGTARGTVGPSRA